MKTIFISYNLHDEKARDIACRVQYECKKLGFTLVTPEGANFELNVGKLESKFEAIKQASLFIGFLCGYTSNVFLELGYALGMGKPVVLITDLARDLPLDLALTPAINYQNSPDEIMATLVKALELHQKEDDLSLPESELDLAKMLQIRVEYPEKFERIPAHAFEEAVKTAFAQNGFQITEINPDTDYGFDFTISKEGKRSLVEVKKLNANGKVSISTIQQLLGAIHAYDAPKALLICTSDFTGSARAYASRHGIELTLWTMEELKRFLYGSLTI